MNTLTGLLLAGGRSSRFGSDKSRFTLPDGRGDMLQRSLALLSSLPHMRRVAVSCRQEQAEEMQLRLPYGVELVCDMPHEHSSPIYGLAAALRRWPEGVLLISCDLPFMKEALLCQLCEARNRALVGHPAREATRASTETAAEPNAMPAELSLPAPPLRTAFVQSDGTVETLVSVYEPESLPLLEAAICAGRLGLYSAIPAQRQLLLPVDDRRAFLNMNSPQDAALVSSLACGT